MRVQVDLIEVDASVTGRIQLCCHPRFIDIASSSPADRVVRVGLRVDQVGGG